MEPLNIACCLVKTLWKTSIYCKIPQEVWFGKLSDYNGLRMFGYLAYARVHDGKPESKAMKCIFLGYASEGRSHWLWCVEEGKNPKFVISIDITFESTICSQIGGGTSVSGNGQGAS